MVAAISRFPTHTNSRKRLPSERAGITHKFGIAGHEGYITVGRYPDGSPGEIFISMAKEGSTISGLMEGLSIALSVGLQYGVPINVIVAKFKGTRFEPCGITDNEHAREATSLLDYLAKWLELKFCEDAQVVDCDGFDAGTPHVQDEPPLVAEAG